MLVERDFEQLNRYLMALFGLSRLRREDDRKPLKVFDVIFPQIRSEFIRLQELLSEKRYPKEKHMMLWLGEAIVSTKHSSMTDRMIREYVRVCDDLECWIIAGISLDIYYLEFWLARLFLAGFQFDSDSYLEQQGGMSEVYHESRSASVRPNHRSVSGIVRKPFWMHAECNDAGGIANAMSAFTADTKRRDG